MTVNGSPRAPTGTVEPTTSGSMSKYCRHVAWLSTSTRGASGSSSPGTNARPTNACTPSVSNNEAETALMVNRTGGSCWTSTSPHVVDPIAAMSTNPASAHQSSEFGSDTSSAGCCCRRLLPHDDQLVLVCKRQRPKEDGIHHGEGAPA